MIEKGSDFIKMFDDLQAAIEELKRDPNRPVQAHLDDFDVELRALAPKERPVNLGEFLAGLGPWEGESLDELLARLREARKAG
ncbi:MAG TPA: hypothetical protein VIJ61_09680 [Thermoanaerobaculia bacterium]